MGIDKTRLPQIAGYTTEAVLGVGGMATVYLAVQESLSRNVALKVMNQLLVIDEDFCRRFLNEGRLVAKLSHPNIVTVYDIGAWGSVHYLSMTYLPGGTLRSKIRGGLPLDRAVDILKRLADALAYAHGYGIVHRDIKPGNVLFTDGGAPVLTDFGIAKTVGTETRLTSTGMTVGSAGYMSPEQALGHQVDHRADLYSLGVLFWQMLTGGLPYSAQDPFALALKHANDPIPRLPGHLSRFQSVIEGLLAKKPEDRVASGEELVRVIDEIPCDDIVASSPPELDETVVLPRAQERTPSHPNAAVVADVQPAPARAPAPRRRLGRATALAAIVGLAGIGGYFGYSVLLSPTEVVPATTPPVQPSAAGLTESVSLRPTSAGSLENQLQKASPPPSQLPDPTDASHGDTASPADANQLQTEPQAAAQGDGQPDIEGLLRQAEDQWNAGRLTEPPGDNAFESYARVLDLDSEHAEAKQRLVQIGRLNAANRMFLSAESLLRQGEIDHARRMIETGLKMNPDDERLLALKRALDF